MMARSQRKKERAPEPSRAERRRLAALWLAEGIADGISPVPSTLRWKFGLSYPDAATVIAEHRGWLAKAGGQRL